MCRHSKLLGLDEGGVGPILEHHNHWEGEGREELGKSTYIDGWCMCVHIDALPEVGTCTHVPFEFPSSAIFYVKMASKVGSIASRLKQSSKRAATSSPEGEKRSKTQSNARLSKNFYQVPCEDLAKNMLGQILVRALPGEGGKEDMTMKGLIVETEAYLGGSDKASHSFGGRRTKRNEAMYMEAGTAYVYSVYGIHCCFNVSSSGGGAAVLVRALQPIQGEERMRQFRARTTKSRAVRRLSTSELCSGPAKLCCAMQIDKGLNKVDLCSSQKLWVEAGQETGSPRTVVACPRVGVDYAGEWADKPLRFYLADHATFVSKGSSTVKT